MIEWKRSIVGIFAFRVIFFLMATGTHPQPLFPNYVVSLIALESPCESPIKFPETRPAPVPGVFLEAKIGTHVSRVLTQASQRPATGRQFF